MQPLRKILQPRASCKKEKINKTNQSIRNYSTHSSLKNFSSLIFVFMLVTIFTLISKCSTTNQMDFYNPYPDKELHLEGKEEKCSDAYERKIWYALYGSYQLNHVNARDLFPNADYTYKIEQITTATDKFLSVLTGLFLTLNRKTLIVKTCNLAKKTNPQEEKKVSSSENKLNELEKEVAYLKGKISGIETTVAWAKQPQDTSETQDHEITSDSKDPKNKSSLREMKMADESKTSDSILKLNPKEVKRISFQFRQGSSRLSKENRQKLSLYLPDLKKVNARFIVIGSADTIGNFNDNLALSYKRALELKNILAKMGISKDKVSVSAAGESKSEKPARKVDLFIVMEGPK